MPGLADYLAFRRTLPPRAPRERLTVQARGLDFAVWRTPAIPGTVPLLCINGGLIFDHGVLWPALAPLAQHRQLIFYDQRGRGASAVPPGLAASRIEFDAADVRALREAMEIPQLDVLGHSWGGGIAMLATAGDVDAVRRLVLVNSVGATSRWLPALHAAALARLTGEARARLAALDPADLFVPELERHATYTQAFFPAWFADAAFAAAITTPKGTSHTGAAVVARLRREGYDWEAQLRGLPTPTLVVHGAADLLPLAEAEATVATLGHATVRALEGAGHNPFWEAPGPFFETVAGFLSSPG